MLAPKSDFIGLDGVVHLATGGEPPLLKVPAGSEILAQVQGGRGAPALRPDGG